MPAQLIKPDSDSALAAGTILRRHGHGSLWPFLFDSDKERWLTDSGAVVVAGRYGRFLIALGDPSGPAESVGPAWGDFLTAARNEGLIPAIYQASGQSLPDLRSQGLAPFRVGQEAILDLAAFDLSGSRRANLRHTITRARKAGIAFHFYGAGVPEPDRETLVPDLAAIDQEWRLRAGPPLGFTIGQFEPSRLDSTAISVATDPAGRVIAFASFLPTGSDGGFTLDLMRRSSGGPPGALEGCIAEAASALRTAGCPYLSLGLVPLAGLDDPGANSTERRLWFLASRIRGFYDVRGLAFFKEKFAPRWEPRYLAVSRARDLPGLAFALVGLHGGGWRAILGAQMRSLRPKRQPPAVLAVPALTG